MPKLDWKSGAVNVWKKEAVETQKRYAELFIDESNTWEGYLELHREERCLLELKIGYALFGPSKELVDEKFDDIREYKYNKKQEKDIKMISDVIYKNVDRNRLQFACIFLICYSEDGNMNYPLFRILNRDFEPRFVDMQGRVYKYWSDFVENNRMPECFYCYPKNGIYRYAPNGEFYLGFEESPECKIGKKVLVGMDRLSIGASLSSAGLLVGSALTLPIAGPVVLTAVATGAACGLWTTFRAVDKLVDRSKHEQDIGLKSAEGRGCWLDISTGVVGTCSMGLAGIAKVTTTGNQLSKIIRVASIAGEISTISVAGASVANHIYEMIDNKRVTITDVMNLAVAVFFFSNAIVNIKTSIKILQEGSIYEVNIVRRTQSSSNEGISQRPSYLSSFDDIKETLSKICYYMRIIYQGCDYIKQNIGECQALEYQECAPKQAVKTNSTNTSKENPKRLKTDLSINMDKENLKHKINGLLDLNQHQTLLNSGLNMEMLFENVDSSDLKYMFKALSDINSEHIDAILVIIIDILIITRVESIDEIKKLSNSFISFITIACRLISVSNDCSEINLSSFLFLMFNSEQHTSGYYSLNSGFERQLLTKIRETMSIEFLNQVYARNGGYSDVYISDIFKNQGSGVARLLDTCKMRWDLGDFDEILNLVIKLIRQYFNPNMKKNGNVLILNSLKLVVYMTSVYSIMPDQIISLKDLINYI